jgi:hypothetical protein
MQDRAVVAAIIAGDADGFAAAYDQYAASLYACCHTVLPEPEAAEAVLDTFLVAAAKLDGLRDPDRLGSWLHAVARNECLRRLGPGGEIPALADPGAELPEPPLPPGFRNRVLTACADNSPAGRAHRMSVAHRAGVFGPAGFPKGIGPSGPSWWRGVRRHPSAVAAAAVAVAAVAVAAGITVAMTAAASHRPQASDPGLSGAMPALASSTTPGTTSRAPSPAHTHTHTPTATAMATASARPTSPPVPAGATSAEPSPGRSAPAPSRSPSPSASPSASPSRSPSASPSRSPSPSPSKSPSPSTSPAPGHLLVAPGTLTLTSVSGKPASGSFVLTAADGPVPHYTVTVAAMASMVKVAPASGSLKVNGKVTVTVTVTSKVALTTHVVVAPGNLTVTVVYKLKPQPSPSPSP